MTLKLRAYQRTAIDAIQQDWQEGYTDVLLTAATGAGKAQPVKEPVLTPTGWTRMGDLQVGSTVIGSDGRPHYVVGVFPQGEKRVYRVTFSDGTTVRCCDDHLWAVRTKYDKRRGKGYRVMPLSRIRQSYLDKNCYGKWFVPIVKPVQFENHQIPIDPYILGYLIGNGCLTRGCVTFSTQDQDVLERFSQTFQDYQLKYSGGYDYWITQGESKGPGTAPLTDALRMLGLWGKASYEKAIPALYKYNAVDIRLDLLRGLMDADGNVHRDSGEFSTSSRKLAEDVAELARSLGAVTQVRVKENVTYTYNGETRSGRACYRVSMKEQSKTDATRCDVCRLKAELEPQSLYDVLCWLSPPIELLDALERWKSMKPLPQPVLDYLERWRKLQTHEPVPELDGKFEAVQGTLLDVPQKVQYG